MNDTLLSTETSVRKTTLLAVVVYEDFSTRERVTAVCDDLVNQFWPDICFKFAWWRVGFLEDDGFAELAVQDAVSADFVIFSGSSDKELTPAVKHWFEDWARHRDGREGALVDLTETANSLNGAAELKKIYLRDIAARALMDYVTKPPMAIHANMRNRRSSHSTRLVHAPDVFSGALKRFDESLLVPTKD